jgi:hypothetical protein
VQLPVHVQQTIEEGQRAADAEHQMAGRKARITNRKGWPAECSEQVRQDGEQLRQDHRSKENRKGGRPFKQESKQIRLDNEKMRLKTVSKRD